MHRQIMVNISFAEESAVVGGLRGPHQGTLPGRAGLHFTGIGQVNVHWSLPFGFQFLESWHFVLGASEWWMTENIHYTSWFIQAARTRGCRLMICLPVGQITYDLSKSEWNAVAEKEYHGGYVQVFLTSKNGFIHGMLMKKIVVKDSVTVFN